MKPVRDNPIFVVHVIVASALVLVSMNAVSELHDRGGGLIYDDVLDVTWLQDVNYAKSSGQDADGRFTWDGAMNWAANLTYYDAVREVVWDDWRLPHAWPVNGVSYDDTFGYAGATDNGYNISSPASELGYMFYVNLGIKAYTDVNGNWPVDNFGFKGNLSGPFERMLGAATFPYWTSTVYPPFDGMAYVMVYKTGSQHGAVKESELLPWALRDGDVAVVPAPAPQVVITSPQPGAVLSGQVNLQVAPQNGNVRTVTFVVSGVVVCGASQEPFACNWDTSTALNGAYTLSSVAIGYDDVKVVNTINIEVAN